MWGPGNTSGGDAAGSHLFPFRTEKLSPHAPMVLPGRVGEQAAAAFGGRRRTGVWLLPAAAAPSFFARPLPSSFLPSHFPSFLLPPSFPAPPRPCSGRGRRPVLLPARERSSRLPVACEPSRPSLRPRKPEANARVTSTCFLEGKSTADPLGTLCKACQCAFCMEKARIVVSHSCREMWFYNISRIIIFRTRLAKPRKPFKRKYPVGMRQSVEAICVLDFKTSQTFLVKPGTGRLNSCLCNSLFHK